MNNMNVLEKILEEIEDRKQKYKDELILQVSQRNINEICGKVAELEEIEKIIRSYMGTGKDTNVGSKRLIDEQPTVCTDNNWIPYTEQSKPKKDGIYLVTCDDEEYPVKRMRFKECLWYWTYGIYDGKILAWQPLPEPYKGEEAAGE